MIAKSLDRVRMCIENRVLLPAYVSADVAAVHHVRIELSRSLGKWLGNRLVTFGDCDKPLPLSVVFKV